MGFEDVFHDLDKALVMKQEIKCFRRQINGKVIWTIEIDDANTSRRFESKMAAFLDRVRRRRDVSDNTEEEI
jgi:hypothetical protein